MFQDIQRRFPSRCFQDSPKYFKMIIKTCFTRRFSSRFLLFLHNRECLPVLTMTHSCVTCFFGAFGESTFVTEEGGHTYGVLRNNNAQVGCYVILLRDFFFQDFCFHLRSLFRDFIFFRGVFPQGTFIIQKILSLLGFESEIPSKKWCARQLNQECLPNILIREILSN